MKKYLLLVCALSCIVFAKAKGNMPTQNGSSKYTVNLPFTLSIKIPPKIY